MGVRLRLGQNYYNYGTLDLIDQDIAATQTRLRQIEKQLAMQRRNLEALQEGRGKLAEMVDRAQARHTARQKQARADKRRTEAEDGDDGL